MPAGSNASVKIFRLVTLDDDVGGSIASGTTLYESLRARIDQVETDSMYIQQGLETTKTFTGIIWGHNLQVREQDEVEVVSPPNHKYYGKRFRVKDAQYDSRHPGIKQSYLLVKLVRSQISHREQFQ